MARDESKHRRDGAGRFDEKMNSEPEASLLAPVPGVLDDDERIAVEMQFGVDEAQVIRDHAISHALAHVPSEGEWQEALGHQCMTEVGPKEAARVVREALPAL